MCRLICSALLLGSIATHALAQSFYLCQDPDTGKKTAQDTPCKTGKAISTYAPVSEQEQKARDERARQSKREFERLRPGTYRPEDYMSDEEFATYQEKVREREAERKRIEDEITLREASRRAALAEQRAAEAERAANEAKTRAAAAEAAANRPQMIPQPMVITPQPMVITPQPMVITPQPLMRAPTPHPSPVPARPSINTDELPPLQHQRLTPRPLTTDIDENPRRK